MAFRILHPAALADDVRRIVSEEMELVRAAWDGGPAAPVDGPGAPNDGPSAPERVHHARTALKRLRALLRLLRPALNEEPYREDNHAMRDLGRSLSGHRDAHVVVGATRALARSHAHGTAQGTEGLSERVLSRSTARTLAGRLSALLGNADEPPRGPVPEAVDLVTRRAAAWPLSGLDFGVLGHGIRDAYAKGRRLHASADRLERPAGHFHEWRKRAKDTRYHVELLHCAWPGVLGALELELVALTDLLGDANDLTLLLDRLAAEPRLTRRLREGAAIARRVETRRAELWRAAGVLGARVYVDPPRAFLRRMEAYWEHWAGCPEEAVVQRHQRRRTTSNVPSG